MRFNNKMKQQKQLNNSWLKSRRSVVNIREFASNESKIFQRISVHSSKKDLLTNQKSQTKDIKRKCLRIESVIQKQNSIRQSQVRQKQRGSFLSSRNSKVVNSNAVSIDNITITNSIRSKNNLNQFSIRSSFASPRYSQTKLTVRKGREQVEGKEKFNQCSEYETIGIDSLPNNISRLSERLSQLKENNKNYQELQKLMTGMKIIQGSYRQLKIKINQVQKYISDITLISENQRIKKCQYLKKQMKQHESDKQMITKKCSSILKYKFVTDFFGLLNQQINQLNAIVTLFSLTELPKKSHPTSVPRASFHLFKVQTIYKYTKPKY